MSRFFVYFCCYILRTVNFNYFIRYNMQLRFPAFTLCLLLLSIIPTTAAGIEQTDSVSPAPEVDSVCPQPKPNIIDRLLNYLDDTNKKKKPSKKLDFSFIGGPFYNSESKFGIGLVAAANYCKNPEDSMPKVSDISLYGQVSTSLLYMIGIRGHHITAHDGFHLNYDCKFYSFPTSFWGIGYNQNREDSNETKYKDFHIGLNIDATWRLGDTNIFAGPTATVNYTHARDIKGDVTLWDGQPLSLFSYGAGVTVSLDTRDNMTATEHGWLLELKQMFLPRFLGNGNHSFSSTEFSVNYYRPLWRGCIIANRFHAFFSYGNTPWNMLGNIGGSYTMRGYYEARYRDKCAMDLTVEFRQHVWKRSGVVLWLGVGSVFPKLQQMRSKELLPNAGIGYRWEFKQHTNVRLDFGIGRGQTGFVFNINEAF